MSESTENQSEPQIVHLQMQAIAGSPTVGKLELTVLPADGIEIEDSDNLKYLRLRIGDYQIPKRVFLTVDGERYEITQDALPEDRPTDG